MLDSQERLGIAISRIGEVAVVDLFGEVDILAVPHLETVLEDLIATQPRHLIFDVSSTGFVCGSAYAAIGRCSLEVDLVSVCSTSPMAKKILQVLGYDRVLFFAAWTEVPVELSFSSN
jgi:anti-anti-sigma factor